MMSLLIVLTLGAVVSSTGWETRGLGLANRVRSRHAPSTNMTLPQTNRKDFAATQREWFLHESQAAKRIIAEAREKIKTSEATLQQQANFRRIRAEEVRQQAALVKNVRQQRKLAGKKRERDYADFRKTRAELKTTLSELDRSSEVSEAMPSAKSDGWQKSPAVVDPPSKAGARSTAAIVASHRLRATTSRDTPDRAAGNLDGYLQVGKYSPKSGQNRSTTAEIGKLRRGLEHNVRRSIARQMRHAAKQDMRSKIEYHRAEEQIGENMGHMKAQLIQLKSQIASSLELTNEKAAELDATHELLRATTQHLQEVEIANKGNAESMMDCDDAA